MIKVKIYTKEHCPACMMTKKLFNKLGVDYKEVTVLQDSPMLEVLREQGVAQFSRSRMAGRRRRRRRLVRI